MHIRLNTITSDHVSGESLFDRYSNYEKGTNTNGNTNGNTHYGIIRPFPWTDPFRIDEREAISWPKIIKRAVEDMSPGIRVNLIETNEAYIVQADLPGYNEDSIKIYMNDNSELHIGAERVIEEREDTKFLIKERFGQETERLVSIPGSVDLENSQADFKDGILTVILPKDQTEKNRHIPLRKTSTKHLPSE